MKDYTKLMKWAVVYMIDRKAQDDRKSKVEVSTSHKNCDFSVRRVYQTSSQQAIKILLESLQYLTDTLHGICRVSVEKVLPKSLRQPQTFRSLAHPETLKALWSYLRCCVLRRTAIDIVLCRFEILRAFLQFPVLSPSVPLSAGAYPAYY
jgi:hypothetical protein